MVCRKGLRCRRYKGGTLLSVDFTKTYGGSCLSKEGGTPEMMETYLELLELDIFEIGEAFGGLNDENVWKRPAEGLLSIGEIAGHIAYGEALWLMGDGGTTALDLSQLPVKSPLLDHRFRYYPTNLDTLPLPAHLSMTAEQVHSELVRVHRECVAAFKARALDLDSAAPNNPPHQTYRECLKYQVFHIAYHTGQIYSARHLLGETTPDN